MRPKHLLLTGAAILTAYAYAPFAGAESFSKPIILAQQGGEGGGMGGMGGMGGGQQGQGGGGMGGGMGGGGGQQGQGGGGGGRQQGQGGGGGGMGGMGGGGGQQGQGGGGGRQQDQGGGGGMGGMGGGGGQQGQGGGGGRQQDQGGGAGGMGGGGGQQGQGGGGGRQPDQGGGGMGGGGQGRQNQQFQNQQGQGGGMGGGQGRQQQDSQQGRGDDRARRLDDVRGERRERREGNRTVIQEGNRTIVRDGNRTIIRRDENDRFRRGGRDVNVQRVGNETRTVVVGPNGQRFVTVTDANGRLLRRSRFVNNREVIIIDNRPRGGRRADAFFVVGLPALAIATLAIPRDRYIVEAETAPPEYIYGALMAPPVEPLPRAYTLDEIRYSPEVRDRMPRIDLDTITFDLGSWEISPDQYNRLAPIADGIKRAVAQNPNEVFLIEGHTDATGNDDDNLSLSDRRAESASVILTDQFQIPPENLTTQGYGSQQPKIPSAGPERANRRVTVRRITPLLQQGQAGDPGAAPPQ